jgi:glycosyltransferase involved in cell wall biosynthesis
VPWLQALDVFELPSYSNEGVPQAIMQAMACRIPVVTTPAGSIGELVRDGDTGLLVPPQNAEALRKALARLEEDGTLRERLMQRAHAHVHAHFASGLMLDRMEALFRSVAASAAASELR